MESRLVQVPLKCLSYTCLLVSPAYLEVGNRELQKDLIILQVHDRIPLLVVA